MPDLRVEPPELRTDDADRLADALAVLRDPGLAVLRDVVLRLELTPPMLGRDAPEALRPGLAVPRLEPMALRLELGLLRLVLGALRLVLGAVRLVLGALRLGAAARGLGAARFERVAGRSVDVADGARLDG